MPLFDPSERDKLIDAIAERLRARKLSAFTQADPSSCRAHVEASIAALEQDLADGRREAVRKAMLPLLEALMPIGLNFSDLRFFSSVLREHVRAALPDMQGPDLDEWFFEQFSVASIGFMVKRDDALQRKAAQREVERFEQQLDALERALADKTQLLEAVRQASTPIAPVVDGILVVPLVGLFDGFRAQALTERLLEEISRTHARAVIIDISGVPVFDTDAAQMIIRLASAVRLLGAEVILVGMSAENARTIVDLGIDLSALATMGSLRGGLARALAVQGLEIVRTRPLPSKRA